MDTTTPWWATDPARDWTEDFEHENGKYQTTCVICEHKFTGHKRRYSCKLCCTSTVKLQDLCRMLATELAAHHQHQSQECRVYFEQDGKPIPVATDLGEAYADSKSYETTEAALHAFRLIFHEPLNTQNKI